MKKFGRIVIFLISINLIGDSYYCFANTLEHSYIPVEGKIILKNYNENIDGYSKNKNNSFTEKIDKEISGIPKLGDGGDYIYIIIIVILFMIFIINNKKKIKE